MQKERNINYDFIRFIAVLSIVLIHVLEHFFVNIDDAAFNSKIFYYTLHTFGRLGVPIFLFLTGALVLKKKYEDSDDIKKFYKYNFLNLIIVCEIWNIIYFAMDRFLFNSGISFSDFIFSIFFFKPYPATHTWYMPMIVGLYATIPFLSILVQRYENIIKKIVYVNIFYLFFLPFVNDLLRTFSISIEVPIDFNIAFGGGIYGVYLLLGYLISKNHNKNKTRKKKIIALILAVFSFMLTIYMRLKLSCNIWYSLFTILIISSCIWYLLLDIKIKKSYGSIYKNLSVLSFGVYLVHIEVIQLLDRVGINNILKIDNSLKTIIYYIITMITSYIIVLIISKNKYMKKYLLFIK